MIARSTREIGELTGLHEWQVRRLYEDGDLPEPPRFAGRRMIDENSVPAILKLSYKRGWLPEPPKRLATVEDAECPQ